MATTPKSSDQQPGTPPSTLAIEGYLSAHSELTQSLLRQLRQIIHEASPPQAVEIISYAMPAFALPAKDLKQKPKPYFGYAPFKHHLGLFPFSGSFLDAFAENLRPYTRTRGSLHISYDQPIPTALIRKLVKARVALATSSLPPRP